MISLGVDIGGTGCKCVAFSDRGTQLTLSYEEYPLAAGTVNLPPDILLASTLHVIRNCVSQLPDVSEIAVVTVSSFGESFVAVDEKREPLDDILMYFGNSESAAFHELVSRIGTDRFMEICCAFPDASFSLSKMLYTIKNAPRPVWKFLFIAGYICWKLSGKPATDVSLARRSLLFDVMHCCWSQELLDASGIREDQLPPVVPSGTSLGNILPKIAEQLGLPADVKVVIGTHDQIVNALGAGVHETGDAVDTSGTCECITPLFAAFPSNQDFLKDHFVCFPYLQNTGYMTHAYNISAGSVVRWYRDVLAHFLKQEAKDANKSIYDLLNESAPSEPTKLMVLPFLMGMGGTPDVDPAATGLIAGLTTQTRLPDIYRAILEGVTFEMRYNQEKLRESGVTFDRLLACGGGARSPVWLQIKADILNCEIIPVQTEETGAMGSAILGFAAVLKQDPMDIAPRFWKYAESVHPNPAHSAIYEQRYLLYKKLRTFYKEI